MNTQPVVKTTGQGAARKKPPKFIERVIDKVEEVLTKTEEPFEDETDMRVDHPQKTNKAESTVQHVIPPTPPPQTQEAVHDEYVLPEGTTIKLPNGKEYETHTKSMLSKVEAPSKSNGVRSEVKKGGE